MSKPRIAFCGMTHLGLNSAVAAAHKGFSIICFDPNAALTARLDALEMPIVEPDINALAVQNRAQLTFTSNVAELAKADVVYVSPDVATDDRGASNLSAIEHLLEIVEPTVRADVPLVILSQVPPGFSRRHERANKPFFYQVETLIFGRAIERALKPERYIIGAADPAAQLPDAFRRFLAAHDCPILVMRYESAELAKIAINCCLVSQVSVANTLAELCEGIGADWHEIVPALKLDRRIGQYAYLAPGLGIAGGNLERDLATVFRLGKEACSDTSVVAAWAANSDHRKRWAGETARTLLSDAGDGATVGLLGLAYKENTHSIKNAPSLVTLDLLRNVKIKAYDPAVGDLPDGLPAVERCDDPLAAATDVDTVLVMTPWPEFRQLDASALANVMRGRYVLDPFRVLDGQSCRDAGLDYLTLGVGKARDPRRASRIS